MAKNNKVNFFAKHNSNIEKLKDLRLYMAVIAVVIFVLAFGVNLYNVYRITNLNREITALSSQMISLERADLIEKYRDLVDGTELLSSYHYEVEKINDEVSKGELIDYDFFQEINQQTPYGVTVDRITVKLDEISIDGTGGETSEIADYQNNLEEITYMNEVHIENISEGEGDYNFTIIRVV